MRTALTILLAGCGAIEPSPPTATSVAVAPGWTEVERTARAGAPGTSLTREIDAPAEGCVAVVLLGATGMDLDARLYAPDGTLLAEDRDPSENAAVLACAPEERLYVQLEVFRGAGSFEEIVLRGSGPEGLEEMVGHRPAGPLAPELRERAREVADAERGFERGGLDLVRAPERVVVDTELWVDVPTERGRCYAVRAVGEGIHIEARDEVGHQVMSGDGLALGCAARTGRWRARLTTVERRSAHLLVASGEIVRWPAQPPRADSLAADRLAELGYGEPREVARQSLRPGEVRAFAVRAQGCELVEGTGAVEVDVAARGEASLGRPFVHVCGEGQIVVRARRGAGEVVLLGRSAPRQDAPSWLDAWLEGAADGFREVEQGECLRVDATSESTTRVSLYDAAGSVVALGSGRTASAWSCAARRAVVEPSSARRMVRRR